MRSEGILGRGGGEGNNEDAGEQGQEEARTATRRLAPAGCQVRDSIWKAVRLPDAAMVLRSRPKRVNRATGVKRASPFTVEVTSGDRVPVMKAISSSPARGPEAPEPCPPTAKMTTRPSCEVAARNRPSGDMATA